MFSTIINAIRYATLVLSLCCLKAREVAWRKAGFLRLADAIGTQMDENISEMEQIYFTGVRDE